MLAEGVLGRLLEVRVVHTGAQYAQSDAAMTWRQDSRLSGKNVLTMGIVHETVQRWVDDDLDWLVADGEVFQQQRCYAGESEPRPIDIPDSLSVFGRFAQGGARLIYHFSGVESGKPCMAFRLNGTRCALHLDPVQGGLLFAKAGSSQVRPIATPTTQSQGWQVEADFVRSIRDGSPVTLTNFTQGLRYMTFTEMVADSIQRDSARVFGADY